MSHIQMALPWMVRAPSGLLLLFGRSFLFFLLALLDDFGFGGRCGCFSFGRWSCGGGNRSLLLLDGDYVDNDLVGSFQHFDFRRKGYVRHAQGLIYS